GGDGARLARFAPGDGPERGRRDARADAHLRALDSEAAPIGGGPCDGARDGRGPDRQRAAGAPGGMSRSHLPERVVDPARVRGAAQGRARGRRRDVPHLQHGDRLGRDRAPGGGRVDGSSPARCGRARVQAGGNRRRRARRGARGTTRERLRVGGLASGRGSNLQALLDASARPDYPAEVVLVISDRERAAALDRAGPAGVEALFVNPKDFGDRQAFDLALVREFTARRVGLVCNAGYMRILSTAYVRAFAGRAMNIHPALLPAFPV